MKLSKLISAIVVCLLSVGLTASRGVLSAPMDLSTLPLDPTSQAHPNIMFLLDDSGSMDFEVMLNTNDGALWWDSTPKNFWGTAGLLNFNAGGNSSGNWYKYAYLFPDGATTDGRILIDTTSGTLGGNDHFAIPPIAAYAFVRSSDYNPLYYNPAVTYTPWAPAYLGSATVTFTNAATTAARSHPYFPTTGTPTTIDLTGNVSSAASNWTFRMLPGMVIPGASMLGITGRKNGTGTFGVINTNYTIPNNEWWDVSIPYFAATYYMRDATCTSGATCFTAPDGKALRQYQIKAGNTFPSGRTYAAELQNFANWFTYYRKRKLMLAASMGNVLPQVRNLFGGVLRFNSLSAVTMYDFNATADSANHRKLLGAVYTNPSNGGTPTRDALNYAGAQYMRTGAGAPIQYACQRNAAFVMTDGFANASSSVSLPTYTRSKWGSSAPYTTIYANTLADIALYYYSGSSAGSLRADIDPTTSPGPVPYDPTVTTPGSDKNPHLHLNVYGLTLNAVGTIWGTTSSSVTDPYGHPPAWPNPNQDRNPTAVDDLWHATINGRGQMYTTSDTAATTAKIKAMVSDLLDKTGAGAAVAVSNVNMRIGDNTAFASNYDGGTWSGDLRAFSVDVTTGSVNTTVPLWSAQTQLEAVDPNARMIVTYDQASAAGEPFRWTQMSSTQRSLLSSIASAPSLNNGKDTLNFLRGTRAPQESNGYRVRAKLLGDIVNAEPVPVHLALANYADKGYSVFAAGMASRRAMVYQGANDGMLHAFDAATGNELWAYVPGLVLSSLGELASPNYQHLPYVDATPAVGDVDFGNTSGGSGVNWRTILVGGLRQGGMGYYALDITTPDGATSESGLASKVLWEFPNAGTPSAVVSNIGYSFAKPLIVKTKAFGWVAIVTSGYNAPAGDGKGYVFVLNPTNGTLLAKLNTTDGTTASPVNLGAVAGWADSAQADLTVDTLYGGDNLGNLWRFDVADADATKWKVYKLASLVTSSGPQPITSAPELSTVQNQRVILVGTGRLFGSTDMSTTATQSVYAIVDSRQNPPALISRTGLVNKPLTQAAGGIRNVLPTPNFDWAHSNGWYIDLPAGERVSGDPVVAYGTLVFTTNLPSAVACTSGSYLYAVNIATGGQQTTSSFATSEQPWTGKYLGGTFSSRPVIVVLPSGEIHSLVQGGNGNIDSSRLPLSWNRQVKKWGWREVVH